MSFVNNLSLEVCDVVVTNHILGRYLEIFGRKNNLRNFWVTVGNELYPPGSASEASMRQIRNQRAKERAIATICAANSLDNAQRENLIREMSEQEVEADDDVLAPADELPPGDDDYDVDII